MAKHFQGLHEGGKYRIENPDGTVEFLTAKEYMARRGQFNTDHSLANVPSPGAGPRRSFNPRGNPMARTDHDATEADKQ